LTWSVDWKDRLPPEFGPVEDTSEGFRTSISIPIDDDGYFGRQCPSCEHFFKMKYAEYEGLPDELELTCPYCGHREGHSSFMSEEQMAVTNTAIEAVGEQLTHGLVNDVFSEAFNQPGQRQPSGGFGVSISYTPGDPPPIRSLPTYAEATTRRIIRCPGCANHRAVYGASVFCPVCGVRPALESVQDAIETARTTLGLEDTLDEEQRETIRAAGIFDAFAADAIKQVVTLFEVFTRERFRSRVADYEVVLRGRGAIFQRLDDVDELFAEHTDFRPSARVDPKSWERLSRAFEQRHVLTHHHGRVDQRYLDRVPEGGYQLDQRLVSSRADAEQALDDLEALIQALANA